MALDPDLIIIGFDAEWVRISDTDNNRILSYQYYGMSSAGTWSDIIYPKGPKKKDRIKLADLVGRAIEKGRQEKFLPSKWPKKVYLAAHFSRADLSAFADFNKLKSQFDSVRKTYTTIMDSHKIKYIDASNNSHPLKVSLVDTMLISPNGATLASLGELHKVPKIVLQDGVIERMDILLEEDPDLFERYAIKDAEISARHAWYMAEFVSDNLGGNAPPITLGSLAVKHFLALLEESEIDLDLLLGMEVLTEQIWDARRNTYITKKKTVPVESVHMNETAASESYHGGRNEAYVFGFTADEYWEDVDLSGAYTTAMAAIRMPDWSSLRVVYDIEQFKAEELGFASVEFSFPESTRFPCLPVRSQNGLIFPLAGISHAGSPEIALAREMGAVLKVKYGVVVPWISEDRPFQTFSADIFRRRKGLETGSAPEKAWKEIGNSLYGKLAQGIKEKRMFDSRSGNSALLPPSKVTQPYLATYVTSLVRAVLGEILSRIPLDMKVISATTDGFISNVPIQELDTSGPLCRLFSDLRVRISNEPDILETKHAANIILCWKTRGQVDAKPDVDEKSIEAKAGIKPPSGLKEEAIEAFDPSSRFDDETVWYADEISSEMGLKFWEPEGMESAARSNYIVDLFLNRETGQKFSNNHLISMRDMFNSDGDMVQRDREQTLNMEFDWKRELVNPEDREYTSEIDGSVSVHLYAETRPWKTMDEFRRVRDLFDEWRLKNGGLLKSMADWERWQEYLRTDSLSKQGLRRGPAGEVGQLKRLFLQAYSLSAWGLPGGGYEGAANYMTECGYPTTENDFKNAKRRKGDLLEHAFERTDEIMKFVNIMLERYPNFDWEKMVVKN